MAFSTIEKLKKEMLSEERVVSIDQARIITEVYRANDSASIPMKRALALKATLEQIPIRITPLETIVGNRTYGVRSGVIFPEAGISWLETEIEGLHDRVQDRFTSNDEINSYFHETIVPFWKGRSLEDNVKKEFGAEISTISTVVKINQKDHAQGHICPDVEKWLNKGICGLLADIAENKKKNPDSAEFYFCAELVLKGTEHFILRYAELARRLAFETGDADERKCYLLVERTCRKLGNGEKPETFHEALQAIWFLFTVLHMESNASSFSPGRMDQYLLPYYEKAIKDRATKEEILEELEQLWLKFNQIVYLRNKNSAKYFAGFPIGFNVAVGGQTRNGENAENELSFLMLDAQKDIALSQPNLSARLYSGSSDEFLYKCAEVIGIGTGMPQVFNDRSVIPSLERVGITHEDALDYAIVGCVELTSQGNYLGWSDAAMFNLVKVLELTLNHGVCLLTEKQIGPDFGGLDTYKTYEELEDAYAKCNKYFIGKMIESCEIVEKIHQETLPSAFLSTVINDCITKGLDVTRGGAHYNLSGIQAIQVANVADSLIAIKKLVYEKKIISAETLLNAIRNDYEGAEDIRTMLLTKAPKYGNDVDEVDEIGHKWVAFFANELDKYTNYRGGKYQAGLYTVSAHIPMGHNVGASCDGRKAKQPLADGGMSAVYGRDISGPTALLNSVSKIDSRMFGNGTLLNMKFEPALFKTHNGTEKFAALLRALTYLNISHVQFNVIDRETLLAAKKSPENYRNLPIRVAGYTAYFTELSPDLQDEIIKRTSYRDAE